MSNTCANCRFWDTADEGYYSDVLKARKCKKIQHSSDVTEWGGEDECENVVKAEFAEDLAFAVDGSGYYAGLITKADFSCAHWTPKKEKQK